MWRLMHSEDGAAAVFVAISLIVLIGFTAFAVDAGALYAERRELQSGADAAALAVAEACGRGEPCTQAAAEAVAGDYADDNASDGFAGIDSVDLDTTNGIVKVTTNTELADGGTVFAPFFAQVLGFGGTTVRARASAAWGFPGGLATLPLIISDCEWEKYKHLVQEGPPFTGDKALFLFHDGATTEDCNAVAGQDWDGDGKLSGGFGWLATSGTCTAQTRVGFWVADDPGASPSTGCDAKEFKDLVLNKTVYLPFFDDIRGVGAGGDYHISGFVAIHVTAYNFGGQFREPKSKGPCSKDERCLEGYLTVGTEYDGELGGPDRGVVIIKLTG